MNAPVSYAALVAELDSPHVAKRPSTTFVAVLRALDGPFGPRAVAAIARAAGTDWAGAYRVLDRARRLGLADLTRTGRAPAGRTGRRYSLTLAGVELVRTFQGAS